MDWEPIQECWARNRKSGWAAWAHIWSPYYLWKIVESGGNPKCQGENVQNSEVWIKPQTLEQWWTKVTHIQVWPSLTLNFKGDTLYPPFPNVDTEPCSLNNTSMHKDKAFSYSRPVQDKLSVPLNDNVARLIRARKWGTAWFTTQSAVKSCMPCWVCMVGKGYIIKLRCKCTVQHDSEVMMVFTCQLHWYL